jgi:hypothetical protein
MKRALSVVLIALLTAAISGIHDTTWASQTPASQAEAHQKKIAAIVAAIPAGSPVRIDPVRGETFEAVLDGISADAIVVRLATGNGAVTRTIPLDEIENLKQIRKLNDHRLRTVIVLVGVGAAVVLVGTCANALNRPA